MHKVCSRCFRAFPVEEIVYRTGKCRPCLREYDRERGKHRRKTAARGYDARWRKLAAAAIRAQPFCSNCGATKDLTVDHVVPATKGRRDLTLSDVQVLCRSCNSSKGGGQGPSRHNPA